MTDLRVDFGKEAQACKNKEILGSRTHLRIPFRDESFKTAPNATTTINSSAPKEGLQMKQKELQKLL